MPLSYMFTKWEKKSQWIVDYALKKITGDIQNNFFWRLALLIHANANILRDIFKFECGFWFL